MITVHIHWLTYLLLVLIWALGGAAALVSAVSRRSALKQSKDLIERLCDVRQQNFRLRKMLGFSPKEDIGIHPKGDIDEESK